MVLEVSGFIAIIQFLEFAKALPKENFSKYWRCVLSGTAKGKRTASDYRNWYELYWTSLEPYLAAISKLPRELFSCTLPYVVGKVNSYQVPNSLFLQCKHCGIYLWREQEELMSLPWHTTWHFFNNLKWNLDLIVWRKWES